MRWQDKRIAWPERVEGVAGKKSESVGGVKRALCHVIVQPERNTNFVKNERKKVLENQGLI